MHPSNHGAVYWCKIFRNGPVTLLRIVRTSVCQRMENFNHTLTYARGTLGNGGIRMYIRQGKHG